MLALQNKRTHCEGKGRLSFVGDEEEEDGSVRGGLHTQIHT